MKIAIAIAFSVIFWASTLLAQTSATKVWNQEPSGYRNVKWGATQTEFQQAHKEASCEIKQHNHRIICDGFVNFDSGNAREKWVFDDDHLTYVFLTFSSDSFDFFRGVFRKAYGDPTKTESEDIQNGFGAKFTQAADTWRGTGVSIMIEKYMSNIKEGGAYIGLNSEFDKIINKKQNEQDKAAKELQ